MLQLLTALSPAGSRHTYGRACGSVQAVMQRVMSICVSVCLCARRDKYERKVKEYWVDTATTGSHEVAEGESVRDRTSAEGLAEDVTLGGVLPGEPLPLAGGRLMRPRRRGATPRTRT